LANELRRQAALIAAASVEAASLTVMSDRS
jgi:hypothetical protein